MDKSKYSQANITQSKFLFAAILLFIFVSISGCSSPSTPTAIPIITRESAIEVAIGGCKIPHLVLVSAPTNIRAKLLTLEEADQITRVGGETTNYVQLMGSLVWLVQLDGQLQLVGGPPPAITKDSQMTTSTPPQSFWGTCSVILDAISGDVISVRG